MTTKKWENKKINLPSSGIGTGRVRATSSSPSKFRLINSTLSKVSTRKKLELLQKNYSQNEG